MDATLSELKRRLYASDLEDITALRELLAFQERVHGTRSKSSGLWEYDSSGRCGVLKLNLESGYINFSCQCSWIPSDIDGIWSGYISKTCLHKDFDFNKLVNLKIFSGTDLDVFIYPSGTRNFLRCKFNPDYFKESEIQTILCRALNIKNIMWCS